MCCRRAHGRDERIVVKGQGFNGDITQGGNAHLVDTGEKHIDMEMEGVCERECVCQREDTGGVFAGDADADCGSKT